MVPLPTSAQLLQAQELFISEPRGREVPAVHMWPWVKVQNDGDALHSNSGRGQVGMWKRGFWCSRFCSGEEQSSHRLPANETQTSHFLRLLKAFPIKR